MSWLKRNVYDPELILAGHFSGTPVPSIWSTWFGGIIVPAVIAWLGATYIGNQEAVLHGRGGSIADLRGQQAILYGVTWLCAAAFLHFHYFWSTLKHLWIFAELGKILALLGFVASLGYVVWSILKTVV